MEANTLTAAIEASRRPWWVLLSFGIALLLFGGIAVFLGNMMFAGVMYLIDDFSNMDEDFWTGVILVVGSCLMFLALAIVVGSEMRAILRKSVAAAKHQAKLWQQARTVVLGGMGLVMFSPMFVTTITGEVPWPVIILMGVFLTICYLSSTHAKWSTLLEHGEAGDRPCSGL